jgi:ABC-type uncharacterized transport system substrate-binding protein
MFRDIDVCGRPGTMIDRLFRLAVLSVTSLLVASTGAAAHPHVWVTMKSELVYAPDGAITGVRHAWTFDDMFSAFATQDIETKQKGVFTREQLAPLAEVNVTSLKEFDYFTFAKSDGKKATFVDPKDYYLDYKDSVLTLNFVLPLAAPAKAKTLDLEVYDPSYFVDFAFAEKDAVRLEGAPAGCQLSTRKPSEADIGQDMKNLSEGAFQSSGANYGAMLANRIMVKCP